MLWFPSYESREIAGIAAWRIQCYNQKIRLSIKKGNVIKWKWFERRTRITRIDWEETLHTVRVALENFYAARPSSKVNNRSSWIWVKTDFHGQPAATQHGTLPGKGSLRQIFLFNNNVNVPPFIILTSKICPKMSLEINFSFSTYCFPMGSFICIYLWFIYL